MLFSAGAIVALLFGGATISMILPTGVNGDDDPVDETPPEAPQSDVLDNRDDLDVINVSGPGLVTGNAESNLMQGDEGDNRIGSWGGDDLVIGIPTQHGI